MYDVITFGGATRDIFFETSKGMIFPDPINEKEKILGFKYGQKIVTDNTYFSMGGGALNSVVSFRKLDLNTGVCINIGKDESAKSIARKLESLGVDTSFVTYDTKNHTALSAIVVCKKDHVALLHRGANDYLKVCEKEKIKNAKWFYITSLTGESADILPELVHFAAENNIKVALNPGSTQLRGRCKQLKEQLGSIELLILNREEAEELACSDDTCEITNDNKILLHKIQKLGPKRVIITEGAKGSYYGDTDIVHYEPAYRKDSVVVDTTGAGDAFGSTFVAGIIKGINIPLAQKMAAINAAHVTEFVGAQEGLLTAREIEGKLKRSLVR